MGPLKINLGSKRGYGIIFPKGFEFLQQRLLLTILNDRCLVQRKQTSQSDGIANALECAKILTVERENAKRENNESCILLVSLAEVYASKLLNSAFFHRKNHYFALIVQTVFQIIEETTLTP